MWCFDLKAINQWWLFIIDLEREREREREVYSDDIVNIKILGYTQLDINKNSST